jgi:peptidoglycan-associated lipoprotein
MGIGDARARAVKTYLTGNGITADRLETTSYGKERPCNPNCGADEGCHAKNRRVEWKVLSK